MPKIETKADAPGLQQQILLAVEQARVAGDNVRHGHLHVIEMRAAELVYATRDAERVLHGTDLDLVKRLRAALVSP